MKRGENGEENSKQREYLNDRVDIFSARQLKVGGQTAYNGQVYQVPLGKANNLTTSTTDDTLRQAPAPNRLLYKLFRG